ncbi:hypothetical protein K439DRAFT_1360754, partial [Ramaria rubella]
LTAAYAFTDYRSQGQMIPNVIVDIATPPTGGKLTLFNLYVALSPSSELDPYLQLEDAMLRELNAKTLEWWERMKRCNNTSMQKKLIHKTNVITKMQGSREWI